MSARWVVIAGALALSCGRVNVDSFRYACSSDADCGFGMRCYGGTCASSPPEELIGVDGGDGGDVDDAGSEDAGVWDSGVPDAGERDGGAGDAGEPDAGDGGSVDGGDGGADAGSRDAGVPDAGPGKGCGVDAGEICNNGIDDDCDRLIDCADPVCVNQSCGTNGLTCNWGGNCRCSGNGGTAQVSELSCADGHDNDCDGLIDCADPDCAGLGCGANGLRCSANSCLCGGNGGTAEPSEVSCSDGFDNDCNGLTDCADPNCVNVTCGANGRVCEAGGCFCSGNGGFPQVAETLCSDGADNDCDGVIDCQDPTCEGRSCGAGCECLAGTKAESFCSNGVDDDGDGLTDCADPDCFGAVPDAGFRCTSSGAMELACSDGVDNDSDGLTDCNDPDCCAACGQGCETICNDGIDNDGDGKIDCADPTSCTGQPCGTNGRVCAGGACVCGGNGGIAQVAESSCFDGADNDCDGLVDCADPDCQSLPCTCEVNCSDGVDNDCNGLTDCADPKCLRKSCDSTKPAAICCGTADAGMCKDLSADSANCGGCGLGCFGGKQCQPVTVGAIRSGRCGCSNNAQCSAAAGQSCSANVCVCSSSAQCAAAEACTGADAGVSGICHY